MTHYDADLRCSYAETGINMRWVYHMMSESESVFADIDFKNESDRHNFEDKVNEWVNDWLRFRVFWLPSKGSTDTYPPFTPADIKESQTIWEFLFSRIEDYLEYHSPLLVEKEDKEAVVEKPTFYSCEYGCGKRKHIDEMVVDEKANVAVCKNCSAKPTRKH